MSDVKIGKLIEGQAHRDAIHVAVAPVVASETLNPGAFITLTKRGSVEVKQSEHGKALGIVDPFLTVRVMKGERFYMFLFQNTVTSLRHEWEHPAFVPVKKEEAAHA